MIFPPAHDGIAAVDSQRHRVFALDGPHLEPAAIGSRRRAEAGEVHQVRRAIIGLKNHQPVLGPAKHRTDVAPEIRLAVVGLLIEQVGRVPDESWFFRRAEDRIECDVGRPQIRLGRFRGDRETFTHVVEARGRIVLRKDFFDADGHAK